MYEHKYLSFSQLLQWLHFQIQTIQKSPLFRSPHFDCWKLRRVRSYDEIQTVNWAPKGPQTVTIHLFPLFLFVEVLVETHRLFPSQISRSSPIPRFPAKRKTLLSLYNVILITPFLWSRLRCNNPYYCPSRVYVHQWSNSHIWEWSEKLMLLCVCCIDPSWCNANLLKKLWKKSFNPAQKLLSGPQNPKTPENRILIHTDPRRSFYYVYFALKNNDVQKCCRLACCTAPGVPAHRQFSIWGAFVWCVASSMPTMLKTQPR